MSFIISIAVVFLISSNIFAQNPCGLEPYTEGKKVNLETKVWSNTLMFDANFQKSKGKKREEKIEAFKADIASGKIKPTISSFSYDIAKVEDGDNSRKLTLKAKVGEQEYTSITLCQKDTMYFSRNAEPIFAEQDGKVIGVTIQGIQVLPKKLEVGQVLSSYTDVSAMIPVKENYTVKHKVFDGTRTKSHIERNTHKLNPETSRIEYGDYLVTTTEIVYSTIDVAVRRESQLKSHTIHYAWAYVAGEEDIQVLGKTYKAYIIESERWIKGEVKTTFEAANEAVVAEQKKFMDSHQKGIEKRAIRSGLMNELGYLTMGMREWYVPELGVVKLQAIDALGIPSSETILTSIK